jgi:PhnB protein
MKSVVPRGWRTVTPRLIVRNPRALVGFIRRVFEAHGRYNDEGPSEIRIGDSVVMVSGTGVRRTYTALLYIYVRDVDATYRRAMASGARSMEKPADLPYGDRRAMFADRWGNTWQVAARLRRVKR